MKFFLRRFLKTIILLQDSQPVLLFLLFRVITNFYACTNLLINLSTLECELTFSKVSSQRLGPWFDFIGIGLIILLRGLKIKWYFSLIFSALFEIFYLELVWSIKLKLLLFLKMILIDFLITGLESFIYTSPYYSIIQFYNVF